MTSTPTTAGIAPRVSIGLPVYNGMRFLARALDSLLGQTFTDFEIVICDNASTDGTEKLCRDYAERDARIVYHRNEANLGAAANFNRVFQLSRKSEYFKWAACDDLCAPTFLERCVDLLDGDPGAVLAYPRTTVIDSSGTPLHDYDVKLETDADTPEQRYHALMGGHACYEIFGLIRRGALEGTPLMGGYSHGDGVLLARLALIGRLEEITDPLFKARRHPEQSATMIDDRQKYVLWFAPHLKGKLLFPNWRMYYEFFRSIHLAPGLSLLQRARCYRRFSAVIFSGRQRLFGDLSFHARRFTGAVQGTQRTARRPKA